ncbi:cytochrome c-type biogenesis protein CcmH/NrfG [Sphingobium subterraneum]|uniref:Cytochrome c-type biogenesis protein CcmH/NrfG n=2 Tax=Sphingobium subterraneum TaxID=627688 RepID=A0A841J1X1_9SPHN|nr:cytochrome C biosynthesis protein [Sphingobium subterraneum]MBB6124352.1 cytochrome c-type biogenesis protein CcmH/NrfG [Sphingobium subterraneum]
MGWISAIGLAVLAAGAIIAIGRLPRTSWELVGAALLIGIAGYAWQGSPSLAGSPRSVKDVTPVFDEKLAEQRRAIGERYGAAGQWLIMSDGLGRAGKTKDAANILISGLRDNPRDPNLWVGMGNALVSHGNGILSPAAEYSYRRAMELAPDELSAPYFFGLALANSGQLDGARSLWAGMVEKLPENSELRTELESKIALIDRAQMAQPAGPR